MAEREVWFHARRAEEGTGYGLLHWKGAVAVAIWLTALLACAVAPFLILGLTVPALAVAIGLVVSATLVFMPVMKTHSDADT